MIFVLDLRTQNRGGPVVPGVLTQGKLEDLQLLTHVTFLVHGFNVTREEGRNALTALAASLSATPGHSYVAVLWPGDHWTGPASYSFEGRDAVDSAARLFEFIVTDLPTRPRISFVAHSLGSRVAMRTVALLATRGWSVGSVGLLAAAIDSDSLSSSVVYRAAAMHLQRVGVLHSHNDMVLKLAYPLGDFFQAFLFWKDEAGSALGLRGPKARRSPAEGVPGNVLPYEIPLARKAGHGDYLPGDGKPENVRSAARFVDNLLSGAPKPTYP